MTKEFSEFFGKMASPAWNEKEGDRYDKVANDLDGGEKHPGEVQPRVLGHVGHKEEEEGGGQVADEEGNLQVVDGGRQHHGALLVPQGQRLQ